MKSAAAFTIVLATAIIALHSMLLAAQTIPEITRPVNDYHNIIPRDIEKRLSDMLVAHREKTGVQMAVLTVCTTGEMSIEEFSLKTVEKWGGGSKERDDGLLFSVAVCDRKMRIETGYGLEGYITDLRAGRILDGIRGDFRKGDYGGGIEKAVKEIIRHTGDLRAGEPVPVTGRILGAFFHMFGYHVSYFILGALTGFLFMAARARMKLGSWTVFLLSLLLLGVFPILVQKLLPGVWFWAPVVFATGALAGAGITSGFNYAEANALFRVGSIATALISLCAILCCLHVKKPLHDRTTGHETVLLVILIYTNIFQMVLWIVSLTDPSASGGYSYGSDGSSYSDSSSSYSGSSSSSSSNDTSWSGGGGSFGGGGASSSW